MNNYKCSFDTKYVLDGMIIMGYVSSEIDYFFFFSGQNVDEFFDKNGIDSSLLNNIYKNWRENASCYERLAVTLNSVYDNKAFNDYIDSIKKQLIQSYTGHSSNLYKRLNSEVSFETINEHDIFSDKNIEKITETDKFNKFKSIIENLYDNFIYDINNIDDFEDFKNWYSKSLNNHRSYRNTEINSYENVSKKKIKKSRKALIKSINFFKKVYSTEKLKLFIHGDGFTLEGKYYNYHIYKNNETNIFHNTMFPINTHIPYGLDLYDKNNIFICKSCVYFPDTPILDQIVSLKFHIDTDEKNILETMNFYDYKDEEKNKTIFDEHFIINDNEDYIDNLFLKHSNIIEDKLLEKIDTENNFLKFLLQTDYLNIDNELFVNNELKLLEYI